jgi:hypothetical protein
VIFLCARSYPLAGILVYGHTIIRPEKKEWTTLYTDMKIKKKVLLILSLDESAQPYRRRLWIWASEADCKTTSSTGEWQAFWWQTVAAEYCSSVEGKLSKNWWYSFFATLILLPHHLVTTSYFWSPSIKQCAQILCTV